VAVLFDVNDVMYWMVYPEIDTCIYYTTNSGCYQWQSSSELLRSVWWL